MRYATSAIGCLAALSALLMGPVLVADAGAQGLLTAEQIELQLFAKNKAISAVRRRSVDMKSVQFELNSDRLTAAALRQLDVLGSVLSKPSFKGSKFVIGGHTDATGSATHNKSLSQQRAEAVVGYLVSQHGIAENSLIPVGYGESRLLPGVSPNDRANRRAEVINIGIGN
ncbi:MAG: OmpA family protein [Gammaproteobacteria bacterium]|nr:OmpA family protein [Gammaproteobacteria bacterium]